MRFRTGSLVGSLCLLTVLSVLFRDCSSDLPNQISDLVPVQGLVIRGDKSIELRSGDFGKVWFYPNASK